MQTLPLILTSFIVCVAATAAEPAPEPANREAIIQRVAKGGEGVWRRIENGDPRLSSRTYYSYALALCEADHHLDRLPRIFEAGAAMQDRDPESRTYGNFLWYGDEDRIQDRNAVEFCMMSASLIWKRHEDKLPEDARMVLRETLDYGIEGCLRHVVLPSYTNIALMRALNLVVLGETLEKPSVAEEGYEYLDRILLYTWRFGVHEYCSPTYYGVDVECLYLLEAFCETDRGREQARALLELFWTDIAANWYSESPRLAGTCSRTYDFIRGLGHLDSIMAGAGWLPHEHCGNIYVGLTRWQPPARLWELSTQRYPRLIEQRWGNAEYQARTAWFQRDAVLSSSGSNYNYMDQALTVDLPGERTAPRCYFIPDGRGDPYGTKRFAAGAHRKARHLPAPWLAVQRKCDALGLAVYPERIWDPATKTLQSHFVMRRKVDGIWVGMEAVDTVGTEPFSVPVPPGGAVVLREGTAAVGVRIPLRRAVDGGPAEAALVYDGNEHGVVRLTVTHYDGTQTMAQDAAPPAAALWVRVGSGLEDGGDFVAWRRAFEAADAEVEVSGETVRVEAEGIEGRLVIDAESPLTRPNELLPEPPASVFAIDGEDIGRRILRDLSPIREYRSKEVALRPVALEPGTPVYLEAEDALILPDMSVGEEPAAAGGRFVWAEGVPGERGNSSGSMMWKLDVKRAGAYRIWGRVLAPTGDDDSFFVRLARGDEAIYGPAAWHTRRCDTWTWDVFGEQGARGPTAVPFPDGLVRLEFLGREDGTKLDRVCITQGPGGPPVTD